MKRKRKQKQKQKFSLISGFANAKLAVVIAVVVVVAIIAGVVYAISQNASRPAEVNPADASRRVIQKEPQSSGAPSQSSAQRIE